MSLMRQLAGDTLIYGLGRVSAKVLNFLVSAIYLTRIFSDGEYGIYVDIYVWATLLVLLLTHRMDTAMFRYGSDATDREAVFQTGWRSVLLFSLPLCLLLWLFSDVIADWMLYPSGGLYVRYFAWILLFDALNSLPFAKLRLEGRARRFAGLQVLNVLITLSVLIFCFEVLPSISERFSADRLLDYAFLSNLVASAVLFIVLFPGIGSLRGGSHGQLWRRMVVYGGPLVVVSILGVVNRNIATSLQKVWLPGSLDENWSWVGIYGACFKIAVLLNLFTEAYNFAAEPFFFKQHKESDDLSIYATAARSYALFGSIVVAFTLMFLPWLRYIIDENYWEGLFIVPGLLLAFYLLGLYYNFSIWFKLQDRTRVGAYLALMGSVVTLALNLWLLPQMGIGASVVAMVATYIIITVGCLWWGRISFPVPYSYSRLFGYPLLGLAAHYLLELYFPVGTEVSGMGVRIMVFVVIAGGLILMERRFLREAFAQKS